MKITLIFFCLFVATLAEAQTSPDARVRRLEIRVQALEARISAIEAGQPGNSAAYESKVDQIVPPLKHCQYVMVNRDEWLRGNLNTISVNSVAELKIGDIVQIVSPTIFVSNDYSHVHYVRAKAVTSQADTFIGKSGFLSLSSINHKNCNIGAQHEQ
jgi:hypothetical protein